MKINTQPLYASLDTTVEVLNNLTLAIEGLPALMPTLQQIKNHLQIIKAGYATLDEHELDCLPDEVREYLRRAGGLTGASVSADHVYRDLENLLTGIGLMEKP